VALTQDLFQVLTDKMVVRFEPAVLAETEVFSFGNTEMTLARYLDENSGDPDLQDALLGYCANVDRQVLAPDLGAYLAPLFGNAAGRALFTGIVAYVTSVEGGSWANLATWIAATGSTLHPLAAEIATGAAGSNLFSLGGAIHGPMHPLMQTIPFDRVYTGTLGALVDDTTDAASVAAGDVPVFTVADDVVVLCSRHRFDKVLLEFSQLASEDVVWDGYYWNGAAWTAVALTDTTNGCQVNSGIVSWPMPVDWVPYPYDNQVVPALFDAAEEGDYYSFILQASVSPAITDPIITWLQLCPEEIKGSDGKYLGVDQPPLAIVEITAANTCTVHLVGTPQINKFECPGIANNALQMRAITSFADNITFTLGYTNQDGADKTDAQAAWVAPIAAGDTVALSLDGADTGLQTVEPTTCDITTTATEGVFVIELADYARAIAAK